MATATLAGPMTDERVDHDADEIDVLIPPPRPWWLRLGLAVLLLVAVGTTGYLWHFGYLRPNPDCCGSGSSSAQIGLAAEPDAVTVTAYFFNSSPVDVIVTGARAELPGAEVLDIAPYPDGPGWSMPPQELDDFPIVTAAHELRWFAVTFRPIECNGVAADDGDWGAVTLELEAPDRWYPTIGRSFTLAEPIVSGGSGELGVLGPASLDAAVMEIDRPLEAACVLLAR